MEFDAVKELYSQINKMKLVGGKALLAIQDLLEEEEYQVAYGTFNQFLSNIGKQKRQVLPEMIASKWIEGLDDKWTLIPINKLLLISKLGLEPSEELYEDARFLSWSDLNTKYGKINGGTDCSDGNS